MKTLPMDEIFNIFSKRILQRIKKDKGRFFDLYFEIITRVAENH